MKYPRLRADLDALAQCGRDAAGGHNRPAFSAADIEGRRWLQRQMTAVGLDVRIDAAANVIGRLASNAGGNELPALMIGSHTDTVPNGGALDGALGVLAGLEVARRLQDEARPRLRPLEIVSFEDEEGRFSAFTGSRSMLEGIEPSKLEQMRDADGTQLDQAAKAVGFPINGFPAAKREKQSIAAYLELHIEQGSVLERKRLAVGIVDAIVGQGRFSIRFEGRADHAGSTPMTERKDAFAAAALFATNLREVVIAKGEGRAVMTIGVVKVEPGAGNVVPARARLALEIRDTDKARLEALIAATETEAQRAAALHGVTASCRQTYRIDPTPMDVTLRGELERAARDVGLDYLVMSSAAGHDAQIVGRHVPAGMIFVPSIGGRSHCPEEATEWSDIERGVDLLYETAARLLADREKLAH
ncbi:MAG TPA: Zn-dependent hydrolase [Pseudolabrys sp.]|nr:Zn-dependent hydrolase [Pseudolabrys sp.]